MEWLIALAVLVILAAGFIFLRDAAIRAASGIGDYLMVQCPKCEHVLTFKSRAGDCLGLGYGMHDVPPVIAADLIGAEQTCSCGTTTVIKGSVSIAAETNEGKG